MKLTLAATRLTIYSAWKYAISRHNIITACEGDVDALYCNVQHALEADFVITERRPRKADYYHRFDWNGRNYETTKETSGMCRGLLNRTSKYIRRRMLNAKTIYVAVET